MIFLKAIILGVVEGVTEFLPISSTGHMILVDEFLKLSPDKDFSEAFMVMIQLPAILAVVLYFWKDLWPFVKSKEETLARIVLWIKIGVAFLPAAVLGLLLHHSIKMLFHPYVVAATLIIGGVILIVLERRARVATIAAARDIGFKVALIIGFIQCLSMIPGTSRSAATIIGAMLLGASRLAAAEFSFFLAIPTMFGATVYEILKNGLHFSGSQWAVLCVGSLFSFVVAYVVVAGFMTYIRRRDFLPFAYYRIVLGLLVFAYFIFA